jgi:hypothetical protein
MPRIGQRVRIDYLGEGVIVGRFPGESRSEKNHWVWEPIWDVQVEHSPMGWDPSTLAPVPESDMTPLED